jgi:hypothetical protein
VLAIFDEAGFCPLLRYVLRSVFRPSLLHSGGRTLVASTPAEEPDHDFTAIAELAEANGAYFNRDVWDNPRLTEGQIEKFIEDDARDEGMSVEAYLESDEFRREYRAERVINKMLLAVPEWLEKRATQLIEIRRGRSSSAGTPSSTSGGMIRTPSSSATGIREGARHRVRQAAQER